MNPITNTEIDDLLDVHRPDRYDAEDHAWRSPVVNAIANRIPAAQATQVAASRLVGDREGRATRAVNQLLRRVAEEQQWPITGTYDDLLRRPLSVGAERVCLNVATANDFDQWAIDERRDAAREATQRFAACDGAEWVASTMRAKGWQTFGEGRR